MDVVDTIPDQVDWWQLHDEDGTKIHVFVRAYAEKKLDYRHWPEYTIDLTKYYEYCKLQDINVLGHTLDRVGSNATNFRCGVSFYFKSYADKAHFVLKFL